MAEEISDNNSFSDTIYEVKKSSRTFSCSKKIVRRDFRWKRFGRNHL